MDIIWKYIRQLRRWVALSLLLKGEKNDPCSEIAAEEASDRLTHHQSPLLSLFRFEERQQI